MDGFYGERDMLSYVGNTGFLWEPPILHEENGAVGSGRIKVVAILRYEHKFKPEYRASLKSEGKNRTERSEEVTGRNKPERESLNACGPPMPIEMRYEVKVQIETVGEELLHVTLSSEDMESMTVFVLAYIAGKLARENGHGRFKGGNPCFQFIMLLF